MTNGNLGAESTLCAYMDKIANADEQTRVRALHFKLKAKRTKDAISLANKNKGAAKAQVKAINAQRQKDLAQGHLI